MRDTDTTPGGSGGGPVHDVVHKTARAHDPAGEVHLATFAGSTTAYLGAVAAGLALMRVSGRRLPERVEGLDVLLGGLAVQRFSRMLATGAITSPLRAPFTRFVEATGASEHHDVPRGGGLRRSVGELLTCPFCVAVWTSTAYVGGLAVAPRPARTWAGLFAVVSVADLTQHLYQHLKDGAR